MEKTLNDKVINLIRSEVYNAYANYIHNVLHEDDVDPYISQMLYVSKLLLNEYNQTNDLQLIQDKIDKIFLKTLDF